MVVVLMSLCPSNSCIVCRSVPCSSKCVYEIVPGFIVSFLAAYLVARFTEAPNAEAVAIFEEATKPDAD